MKDMHAAAVDCCCNCGKDSGGPAAVRRTSSYPPKGQLHLKAARVSFLPAPSSLQSQQTLRHLALNSRAGRRLAAPKAFIMLRSVKPEPHLHTAPRCQPQFLICSAASWGQRLLPQEAPAAAVVAARLFQGPGSPAVDPRLQEGPQFWQRPDTAAESRNPVESQMTGTPGGWISA